MRLPRPEDLHTIEQAARALKVPAGAITMWKKRGLVMPATYLPERVRGKAKGETNGRPLFYLEELRPRADAYHRRRTPRQDDTSAPP